MNSFLSTYVTVMFVIASVCLQVTGYFAETEVTTVVNSVLPNIDSDSTSVLLLLLLLACLKSLPNTQMSLWDS